MEGGRGQLGRLGKGGTLTDIWIFGFVYLTF